MLRHFAAAVLVLAVASSPGFAKIFVIIFDRVDDSRLVGEAVKSPKAKEQAKELKALRDQLYFKDKFEIERLLGKSTDRSEKAYAMPIGQPRGFVTGGMAVVARQESFYEVDGIGGFEVYYAGGRPEFVAVYLKINNQFPVLTEKNLESRLAWDRDRIERLSKILEEREKKK